MLRMCRNLEAGSKKDSVRGQLRWSRLVIPDKALQIEQTACIGRYLRSPRKAVRGRMYQLYEAKKDESLSKLLGNKTSFPASLKAAVNNEFRFLGRFTHHGYSWCCCFTSSFADTQEHCLQSP